MFSFGNIAENFEVLENDIFDCKVLCVVGKCEWNSVGFFMLSTAWWSDRRKNCNPGKPMKMVPQAPTVMKTHSIRDTFEWLDKNCKNH